MDEPTTDIDLALTLDGNAVGGPLADVFGREMTDIENACAHCGTTARLAELRAYVRGPGVVLRCAACSGIVLVIVATPARWRVDGPGVSSFEVPAG